jgi:ribosomal protein S18 acetylase RimI-like enzyme
MIIRPATIEDVPAVLPMVSRVCALHEAWDPAKYSFKPNPAEMYRRWMSARATDPRSVFLVAQRPDANDTSDISGTFDHSSAGLIGFLVATIETEIPIYRLSEYGFIHDLWVEPEYRHEGVARQLTMLAIERFTELGVRQIRLDTAAPNDAARALFSACGFRVSTTEMLLELPARAPLS